MEQNLERFKGQYLKDDGKKRKSKDVKHWRIHEIQAGIGEYNHNGKISNHGGAL